MTARQIADRAAEIAGQSERLTGLAMAFGLVFFNLGALALLILLQS